MSIVLPSKKKKIHCNANYRKESSPSKKFLSMSRLHVKNSNNRKYDSTSIKALYSHGQISTTTDDQHSHSDTDQSDQINLNEKHYDNEQFNKWINSLNQKFEFKTYSKLNQNKHPQKSKKSNLSITDFVCNNQTNFSQRLNTNYDNNTMDEKLEKQYLINPELNRMDNCISDNSIIQDAIGGRLYNERN